MSSSDRARVESWRRRRAQMVAHILTANRKNSCGLNRAVISVAVLPFGCAVAVHRAATVAAVATAVVNGFKSPRRGDAVSHTSSTSTTQMERGKSGGFGIGNAVNALGEVALLRGGTEGEILVLLNIAVAVAILIAVLLGL